MTAWLMLAGSILFNVAGNLLVKQFSTTTAIHGIWDYFAVPFVFGVAAFGVGVMLYGRALRDIPIVLAYPIQVGTCVLVIALFAVALFGEKIGLTDMLGILLILSGIALLSRIAA